MEPTARALLVHLRNGPASPTPRGSGKFKERDASDEVLEK